MHSSDLQENQLHSVYITYTDPGQTADVSRSSYFYPIFRKINVV